jgi:hypothetical protein
MVRSSRPMNYPVSDSSNARAIMLISRICGNSLISSGQRNPPLPRSRAYSRLHVRRTPSATDGGMMGSSGRLARGSSGNLLVVRASSGSTPSTGCTFLATGLYLDLYDAAQLRAHPLYPLPTHCGPPRLLPQALHPLAACQNAAQS